jgi:aspartate--ammonia ligase
MSKPLIVPVNYKSLLDLNQTEKAIKLVKDTFQQQLSAEIHLRRVTAPLFVLKGTGINDDLNGTERKVGFPRYERFSCRSSELTCQMETHGIG